VVEHSADPSRAPDAIKFESLRRWGFIIGTGIFATTMSQPGLLDVPIRNLLKNELGVPPQQMAAFFAVSAFPWYLKVAAGLLSDTVPLFGTRRRHYLIFSSILAGAAWLVLAYVPRSYSALLATVLVINAALVIGSTVIGGLLVEAGQRLGAAGRLVAVRIFVDNACILLSGPLAGRLAGLPFDAAAGIGAAVALTMLPMTVALLKEPVGATFQGAALANAYAELRSLLRSRPMWAAAAFLFFATLPQEFQTPLFYYQVDVLHISPEQIGDFRAVGGGAGLLATVIYPVLHRRLSLRPLLGIGIVAGALGAIIYLLYRSVLAAFAIEGIRGFLLTFGMLAFMEIAVWATPANSAAMGFALLMSAWNIGAALGDTVAAALGNYIGFFGVATVSAAATAMLLLALPFLPHDLATHREGEASETSASAAEERAAPAAALAPGTPSER
jgi:hypothetical protein